MGFPFHSNDILSSDQSSKQAGKNSFLTVHKQQEALILTAPDCICSYSTFSQLLLCLILRTADTQQGLLFFFQTRKPSFRYVSKVTQLLSNRTGHELWSSYLESHMNLMIQCFLSETPAGRNSAPASIAARQ